MTLLIAGLALAFIAAYLVARVALDWVAGLLAAERGFLQSELPAVSKFERSIERLALRLGLTSRLEGLRAGVELNLGRLGDLRPDRFERFVSRSLGEALIVTVLASLTFSAISRGPVLLVPVLLGLGYFFLVRPRLLHGDAEARLRRLRRGLGFATELMVMMLSAGGTLREGIEKIAAGEDDLSEEFARVLNEIRAGTSQREALGNAARRLELDEFSSLAAAINRGEATGAPMAKVLGDQGEGFRFRRIQRAERAAAEAPVKMMLPNTLIMAAVLLIILGPAIIKIFRSGMG